MRLIVTCGCGDTTQFAKDAFKIMFPKEELPKVIESPDNEPYALLIDFKRYNGDMKVKAYDLMKGQVLC